MSRLAVIPARGGSKRIPRKNVRDFCGKPMIAYAIQAAQAAGLFEHIVVSTDDREIADIATALGAEVPFTRPEALADDFAGTIPVVAHAVQQCRDLGWDASNVSCIYPCVPFIEVDDLRAALTVLEDTGSNYVFPVAAFASPIQRALKRRIDGTLAPFDPQWTDHRTQDLEAAFYDAGQFYWGTASAWLGGLNVHQNSRSIELPEWRVVDIDTPADWQRAELLFRALRG